MQKLILLLTLFMGTSIMFSQTEPKTRKDDQKEDRKEKKMQKNHQKTKDANSKGKNDVYDDKNGRNEKNPTN